MTPLVVLALDSSDRLEAGPFEINLTLRDHFKDVVPDASACTGILLSCTISLLPVCFFDMLIEMLSLILKHRMLE
jgi:hypothetical protein